MAKQNEISGYNKAHLIMPPRKGGTLGMQLRSSPVQKKSKRKN